MSVYKSVGVLVVGTALIVLLLSQLRSYLNSTWAVFVSGVFILTPLLLYARNLFNLSTEQKKKLPSYFEATVALVLFSCFVDLQLSLENLGIAPDLMGYYIKLGEPYLGTHHGTAIMIWDGIFHLSAISLVLFFAVNNQDITVPALLWLGSYSWSIPVLLVGGSFGPIGFHPSTFLNVPYVLICIRWLWYFFVEETPLFISPNLIYNQRLVIMPFLFGTITQACMVMIHLTCVFSPEFTHCPSQRYILSESGFPVVQYGFFLTYSFVLSAFLLIKSANTLTRNEVSTIARLQLLNAGVVLQTQFSYIMGGYIAGELQFTNWLVCYSHFGIVFLVIFNLGMLYVASSRKDELKYD